MTDWASAADVEQAAQRWSDGVIRCRTYGHPWRPSMVTHRPGSYTIAQVCPRCGNHRRQDIDERGYPLSQWKIGYEPGYLLRNIGRVGTDGRAVLRLATLRGLSIVEESVA